MTKLFIADPGGEGDTDREAGDGETEHGEAAVSGVEAGPDLPYIPPHQLPADSRDIGFNTASFILLSALWCLGIMLNGPCV